MNFWRLNVHLHERKKLLGLQPQGVLLSPQSPPSTHEKPRNYHCVSGRRWGKQYLSKQPEHSPNKDILYKGKYITQHLSDLREGELPKFGHFQPFNLIQIRRGKRTQLGNHSKRYSSTKRLRFNNKIIECFPSPTPYYSKNRVPANTALN